MTLALDEITIARLQELYSAGEVSVTEVVSSYLARIAADAGADAPLNAIVTVNPAALDEAARLDDVFATSGRLVGPLHGVPVVVKDQIETEGIETAFGSAALAGFVPAEDAHAIGQLRAAGAIVLAKTTLPDFASSWFGNSSRSGITRNPYDRSRDTGGSSSGTAAAVAANLATVGVGEDTGGSIRVPSSFCNLVGLRPTPGMISRHGMSSLIKQQDTAGPMGRTVADVASVLDALVGFDPADDYTVAFAASRHTGSYTDALDAGALQGKRIGVIRSAFAAPGEERTSEVAVVCDDALSQMAAAGADIVDDIEIPGLAGYLESTSMYHSQSLEDMNEFLSARDMPFSSLEDIVASGQYYPIPALEEYAVGPKHAADAPGYLEKVRLREEFQRVVMSVLAAHKLDAIAYPSVQVAAPLRSEIDEGSWVDFPTNTIIASQAWLPAISIPAGFTRAGLPVGLEVVALPYGEAELIGMAYAFETHGTRRRAPGADR